MRKVLVVTIISSLTEGKKFNEFELTELNKHLSEGWKIDKQEIVTNQTAGFSIVYLLAK